MKYVLLSLAILSEVIATTAMKQSDGFTRLGWSAVTIVGYILAFYLLSLALRSLPTGIAYAIWAGVGIVLITLAAWLFQGQKMDPPASVGMAFIIAGVCIMNLFSKAVAH